MKCPIPRFNNPLTKGQVRLTAFIIKTSHIKCSHEAAIEHGEEALDGVGVDERAFRHVGGAIGTSATTKSGQFVMLAVEILNSDKLSFSRARPSPLRTIKHRFPVTLFGAPHEFQDRGPK